MLKNIVSDTSCLILLRKIDRLDLLQKVFGSIYITDTISQEIICPVPEWMKVSATKSAIHKGLLNILDPGESSSIALATELHDSLLIIDESKGRKIARRMSIQITGTMGVLLIAKKKGYIPSLKTILDEIEATNFRISPLIVQQVLQLANEK